MPANLTEKEFSQHVNTTFRASLGVESSVDLELTEVKPYMSKHAEHDGMERFSAYFTGPADVQLLQATYHLQHESMGELDIFLVPIARDEKGFRYEAVFNYFKTSDK